VAAPAGLFFHQGGDPMISRPFLSLAFLSMLLLGAGVSDGWAQVAPPASASPSIGGELTSDFKYLANNFELDAEDVVTSPLHIGTVPEMLTSPRFYLIVGGAGALFGGSFALDQTMRSHLRSMSSGTPIFFRMSATAVSRRPPRCSMVTGYTSAIRARGSML
jgi:hypothetical protein